MHPSFEKKTFIFIFFIILGLEFLNFYPQFLFLMLVSLSIFLFVALSVILKIKLEERNFYPIFVLPFILLIESTIVTYTIPVFSMKHLFIMSFGFLLYLVIFSLKSLKENIISYSVIIFNILTISYLISAFFAFVSLYNFFLLYELPTWFMMILVGIVSFLFFLFHLWENNLLSKNPYIYNFILSMILVEFFWAISFWPLLALPSGFVLFLIYYIFSDLFTLLLKGELIKKRILLNHLTIPFIVLIFFLASCKW